MNRYYIGLPKWKDARPIFFRGIILLGDLAVVSAAYSTAYFIRFWYSPFISTFPITKGIPEPREYVAAAPVILFMWALAISWQGGYKRIAMPAVDEAIRMGRAAF